MKMDDTKGKVYDAAVVGGGIVGCAVFHALTERGLDCCLLEAGADVAQGSTRANSGILHAGYDCETGTLKAKLNVRGNALCKSLARSLGVPMHENGSLVLCGADGLSGLKSLKARGEANGVEGLSILSRPELLNLEPNLAESVEYGLHAPSAGVINIFLLTVALAESAVINGGEAYFDSPVTQARFEDGIYTLTAGGREIRARYAVNCAGAGAADVNSAFGAEKLRLKFRRGEYYVLDRVAKGLVSHTLFPLPTELGKGILVTPTTEYNVLLGPTSEAQDEPSVSAEREGLAKIRESVSRTIGNVPWNKVIRVFAGTRCECGDDFVIRASDTAPNYVYAAGINSPGLTAAPAIAEYIAEILQGMGLKLRQRDMKRRKPYTIAAELSREDYSALIARKPEYGNIICRCERVSEGEILEALRSPLRPRSADAVKRRVRPGGGRCQGGFCLPKVMDIISREYGMPLGSVCKEDAGSELAPYKVKEFLV